MVFSNGKPSILVLPKPSVYHKLFAPDADARLRGLGSVGFNSDEPQAKHVEEIVPAIDQAVAQQCDSIFIEILATPGHRTSKPKTADSQGQDA